MALIDEVVVFHSSAAEEGTTTHAITDKTKAVKEGFMQRVVGKRSPPWRQLQTRTVSTTDYADTTDPPSLPVILSCAKDPSAGRNSRHSLGSFARLGMTDSSIYL